MTPLGPRVVLDTNIFVSRYWGGFPEQAVQAWLTGKCELLMSRAIMDEMERTLTRVLGDRHEWRELLVIVEREATWATPSERLNVVAADPSDNRFLECAVEGRADYLVSGDAHLL